MIFQFDDTIIHVRVLPPGDRVLTSATMRHRRRYLAIFKMSAIFYKVEGTSLIEPVQLLISIDCHEYWSPKEAGLSGRCCIVQQMIPDIGKLIRPLDEVNFTNCGIARCHVDIRYRPVGRLKVKPEMWWSASYRHLRIDCSCRNPGAARGFTQ